MSTIEKPPAAVESTSIPCSDVPARKLQADALGLLATAALTAAYMGPALSIYALYVPMSQMVGSGVGFVMLLGMLMTLPSAISFGMLAREVPLAGGVYTWCRLALGESTGLWVGLTAAAYYTICLVFPPIVFGQFLNDLLKELHIIDAPSIWVWLVGSFFLLYIAGRVTYRGIVVSSHLAFTLLLTEVAVIVALAATFIFVAIQHHTFSWQPFTYSGCTGGWRMIFMAMPLALLSMACDAATPASEETRNAKWTIPVAVVLTCFIIGLWYVIGFSAFAMAPNGLAKDASIAGLAGAVWGPMKILVTITGMTAAMGAFIPGATAASRIIYAMGRDRRLPAWLGTLNEKYLSPWNALHVVYGVCILAFLPASLIVGADPTITWWGGAFGWFIAVVYTAANVANTVFYWRFRRSQFSIIWNLLAPAAGVAAQLMLIWRSIIVELWAAGTPGRTAQVFIGVVALTTAVYAVSIRKTILQETVTGA